MSRIRELLEEAYGPSRWHRHDDPVSELVGTILSQNTSDTNSARAFAGLRERFPTWDDVRDAPTPLLADAIRSGGLADQKAPRIQQALEDIHERTGNYNLDGLKDLPVDEAMTWLTSMHGVGPKTAACVLLFSLGMPALPVDTHVYRVSKRLGLIGDKVSPIRAPAELEAQIGDNTQDIYAFHIQMIHHGRIICRARVPHCPICPLKDECDYFRDQFHQQQPE